ELLPRATLGQRLARGPLPVSEAIRITQKLAGALEAAHAQRILHLDIKPENIIFGEGDEPKLADFGISRSLLDGAPGINGTIVGTAAYLAPESVAGEPLDARADVYSLGVVLYEMLTGERPFPGETPVEQATQRLTSEPIPPQALNPAVPPQLGQIVLQALARDPADRFSSPKALAMALLGYEERAEQRTTAIPASRIAAASAAADRAPTTPSVRRTAPSPPTRAGRAVPPGA